MTVTGTERSIAYSKRKMQIQVMDAFRIIIVYNSFFLKLTAATISMRRDMLHSILISPSVSATADLYLLLKMQQTKKAEQHDQSHTPETSTILPDFFVDVEVDVAVDEVVEAVFEVTLTA
jgi:transaldolase